MIRLLVDLLLWTARGVDRLLGGRRPPAPSGAPSETQTSGPGYRSTNYDEQGRVVVGLPSLHGSSMMSEDESRRMAEDDAALLGYRPKPPPGVLG